MALLRVDTVRKFIDQEVLALGSQLGWAKKIGVRSSDVNKTLKGKRLAARSILNAVALRKVPAYGLKDPPHSTSLLSLREVVELIRAEVRKAGSQSHWARRIGARQSDINNALGGRRLPVKAILDAIGLQKVVAYEKATG
jgi:DNA-binding transcriptional regulator YdaS (Cro superfamily)